MNLRTQWGVGEALPSPRSGFRCGGGRVFPIASRFTGLFGILVWLVFSCQSRAQETLSPEQALAVSQAAIGRNLGVVAEEIFRDEQGQAVRLSQFYGQPLVLTMIYTACATACPLTLKTVATATDEAWRLFGSKSFTVITIGFDAAHDTPERMRQFTRAQGLARGTNWIFLTGDMKAMAAITQATGFTFFLSPRGFDHITQTTIINGQGRIDRQIYGETFPVPLLVGVLRELLFGGLTPFTSLDTLLTRVRLFCVVYDPAASRYRFSYAVFFELLVAGLTVVGLGVFVTRNVWRLLWVRQ